MPALNSVIPAIAGNFASSSDKIRSAAEETLDRLIESVDGVYIVQVVGCLIVKDEIGFVEFESLLCSWQF